MKSVLKLMLEHGGGAAGFDADAAAFFASDATLSAMAGALKTAVNTLVLGLKADSLWTGAVALYPVVGGAAGAHSRNLRNPATFQLAYTATVTHSANGMVGDGATGFANTGIVPSVDFLADNKGCFGYYSRTDLNTTTTEVGSADTNTNRCRTRRVGQFYADFGSGLTAAVADSLGLSVVNIGTANLEGWKNGVKVIDGANTPGRSTNAMYLMALNNTGVAQEFSLRQCAFACFYSNGLSAVDQGNLYSRIQTYQTALGRNV